MSSASLMQKLDDVQNPIVVKELRQAVHSRLVVAVLMLFLGLQLLAVGTYLFFEASRGATESIEFQGGQQVFSALQVILLGTCMVFLPAYTGMRLAAERNEVNTDLLFVTTLRPGKIISGKIVSAVVLALLIFSACTPFMLFTYFLRGIDWPSILFVVLLDFLVVIGTVQIMVFLAVVPANRALRALLGLAGLGLLLLIFSMTVSGSLALLYYGVTPLLEDRDFWLAVGVSLLTFLGAYGLLYTWSVALISPPSSNRALPVRLYLFAFWVVSGAAIVGVSLGSPFEIPFGLWLGAMISQWGLYVIIAINERERWSPRVARTIPKSWLGRAPAFLFYSGSAGGIVFATLMMAATTVVYLIYEEYALTHGFASVGSWRAEGVKRIFEAMGILFLYTYCYALTAVLVRSLVFRNLTVGRTWVVMLVVAAAGSLAPMMLGMMLHYGTWRYDTHFYWLLGNPAMAFTEFAEGAPHRDEFFLFSAAWAVLVTALCLPWALRQLRAFKPLAEAPIAETKLAEIPMAELPMAEISMSSSAAPVDGEA